MKLIKKVIIIILILLGAVSVFYIGYVQTTDRSALPQDSEAAGASRSGGG